MNRLIFRDAPLRTALELYFRTVGIKNYVIDNAVLGIVTGSGIVTRDAFPDNLFPGVTHRIKNNVLFIHQAPTAVLAERVEAVLARKLTSPTIFGAPRRVAAVLLGEKPLALLETGNPPQTKRQIVTEGDTYESFRVSRIDRDGIVLQNGERRFLVPLTPLSPKP